MPGLSEVDHRRVQSLTTQFHAGDESAKNVSIRDDLAEIFEPTMLSWRLLPDQVGIHFGNRDGDQMTADHCVLRGKKILASGFSYAATGTLWAMEDNPTTRKIARHTDAVLSRDNGFAPCTSEVKVGPLNWTHSNQFVRMVEHCAQCNSPDIPVKDGRIDKLAIMADDKNKKMFSYIKEGMVFKVFPYWVEEQYPDVATIFQAACNQEQQVQEGLRFPIIDFHTKTHMYFFVLRFRAELIRNTNSMIWKTTQTYFATCLSVANSVGV
jgi:hypothetical protein